MQHCTHQMKPQKTKMLLRSQAVQHWHDRRWHAEAASECAAAEAGAVAAVPVEQAVQHYSRTWLIAAVEPEVVARASATLAQLVVSRGQALTPQRL